MSEQAALDIINKVFAVKLAHEDLDKKIKEVLKWDSVLIVSLMSEVMNKFGAKIDVESLFSIETINNLVDLMMDSANGV